MDTYTRAPQCVGIIMDGNRRWAQGRSLPSHEGHREGYEVFKKIAQHSKTCGVQHLVVYAFSTENWKRSEKEVAHLMDMMRILLKEALTKESDEYVTVARHVVGDLSLFPKDIQQNITTLHARNPTNPTHHLWIAASYGGRAEIISAVQELVREGVREVTEDVLTQHMWTVGMPDPDIIVRTGGARRLSNFLLWQSAYSELFFVDTLWPDFTTEMFDNILAEYKKRLRNFGV